MPAPWWRAAWYDSNIDGTYLPLPDHYRIRDESDYVNVSLTLIVHRHDLDPDNEVADVDILEALTTEYV